MAAKESKLGATYKRCATAGFAFVSIALPIGIVFWTVYSAMSGKPVLHPSGTDFIFRGLLTNGEMNDDRRDWDSIIPLPIQDNAVRDS